jgi:hypothetical protein
MNRPAAGPPDNTPLQVLLTLLSEKGIAEFNDRPSFNFAADYADFAGARVTRIPGKSAVTIDINRTA